MSDDKVKVEESTFSNPDVTESKEVFVTDMDNDNIPDVIETREVSVADTDNDNVPDVVEVVETKEVFDTTEDFTDEEDESFEENFEEMALEQKKEEVKAILAETPKVRIKANERVIVEAFFVDDFGNDAPFKEDPVWTSSDPEIVECCECSDKSMCDIRPAGKLGTAIVTVSSFGDKPATGDIEVTVLAATLATQVGIKVRTVEKWH